MKDYNKLMKEVSKNPHFRIDKSGRKNTIKLIYIESGEMYSIHPGDNAINPLKKWMKKFEIKTDNGTK